MQELDEFLNKQRELTLVMLENMLTQQSLHQHNLSIGLSSLKHLIGSLPDSPQKGDQKIKKHQYHCCKQSHIYTLYKNDDISGVITLESDLPEIHSKTNFSITISIRNLSYIVVNEEEIPIELRLYTAEKFPRRITSNKKGKPIIQGKTTVKVKGIGRLQLSITEPSQHYPSGQFSIVIFSEKSEIQPLILEGIVVKRQIK